MSNIKQLEGRNQPTSGRDSTTLDNRDGAPKRRRGGTSGPGTRKSRMPRINPKRLDHIETLLAQLWPHARIIRTVAVEWECSTTTVENYIRRVYERAAAEAESMRAMRREEMRLAIREHYRTAIAAGEISAAGPDLDRLAKLDGLYSDKFEFSGPGGAPITVDMTAAVEALSKQVVAASRRVSTASQLPSKGSDDSEESDDS